MAVNLELVLSSQAKTNAQVLPAGPPDTRGDCGEGPQQEEEGAHLVLPTRAGETTEVPGPGTAPGG